ncbi:MAG: hypothetical protein WC328_05435 [Kiritimatiellia bacterium]
MRQKLTIILLWAATTLCLAETPQERFDSLTNRLACVLAGTTQQMEIASTSNRWIVTADTMTYTVHGESKTGEYASRTHEETGPRHRGFILDVNLLPLNPCCYEAGQLHRRPCWTDYVWHGCSDETNYIHVVFKIGNGMSEDLKKKIITEIER